PDLEERGEEMRHVAVGHEPGARDLEQALDVVAEPAIEAHGSGGRTLVDQPVEVVVVAGEQQVDDDVLVTLQVLRARPGLLGQPRGDPLAELRAAPRRPAGAASRSLSAPARSRSANTLGGGSGSPVACQSVPPGTNASPS